MKHVISICLGLLVTGSATTQEWPDSIAVLGDSISRGVFANDTIVGLADGQPWHCWSTGGCPADGVFSHYERILQENEGIHRNNHNFAVSGAQMAHLVSQANEAVDTGAEYITVFMGANDICAPSVAYIKSPDQFQALFTNGLEVLLAGLPDATIVVAAFPDIYCLWEVGHVDLGCLLKWSTFKFCDSMLRSSDADRAIARSLNIEFNNRLSSVCATNGVIFDNSSFEVKFAVGDVSFVDCFHPAESAHQMIADATYDPSRF